MNCKYCKREIEDDSVFCRFCGERVQRAKRKPKEEIPVPAPTITPSGKYRGRLMVDGKRVYVTEDTEAAYYIRARAVKAGLIQEAKAKPKNALGDLIDKYIADNSAVLSPSTVAAYKSMRLNAFPAYMTEDAHAIQFQRMISEETKRCSAKTLQNRWRLVTAALRYAHINVQDVMLPRAVKRERAFLDFEQIQTFCEAIKGDVCEAAYLLALHSLRLSEIQALTRESVDEVIRVRGAVVYAEGYVRKELNKTDTSRRDVPVMIPRLLDLIDELPITWRDVTLNRHLEKICDGNGLPVITLHGLRHSFASLAYHLKWTEKTTMRLGGWSTPEVVHDVYTHLADKDVSEDVEKMRQFYTVGKTVGKNDD